MQLYYSHMLKIAHIAPENYTGIIMDYVRGHQLAGNTSRLITLFKSKNSYAEDICLNLPLVGWHQHITLLKKLVAGNVKQSTSSASPIFPKQRNPDNAAEKLLFNLRDQLWKPYVTKAFDKYDLWNFDIYHLEGGMGFLRNSAFIQELKSRGKRIVCHYHGLDLRVRGVIPQIDQLSDLNITCEYDLLDKHPNIQYHFLPFDTDRYQPTPFKESGRLRIVHSPRNRDYKGTEHIITTVDALKKNHDVELVLIENRTHAEAMAIKSTCDIAIDQVVDDAMHSEGGTGYGVNSLETLSLGIPSCTNITEGYAKLLGHHPFINVSPATLHDKLAELVTNPELRRQKAAASRGWVVARHGFRNVVADLYRTYLAAGWIDENMHIIPPIA